MRVGGVASIAADDPVVVLMAGPGYDLGGLRRDHVDDGAGLCRACGGPQAGRTAWPCYLIMCADRADIVRDEQARARSAARRGGR